LIVTATENLGQHDLAEVVQLIDSLTAPDGTRPISEHVELHLREGGDLLARHLLVRNNNGLLVGYAHLDCSDQVKGPSAEIVISQDSGPEVLGHLLTGMTYDAPESSLRLWARGDSKHLIDLASEQGLSIDRELVKMGRSLFTPLPQVDLPTGFTCRTFVLGQDEEMLLSANREIFTTLPDQKRWTRHDLAARMNEDWFDPLGFFLIFPRDEPERLAAFHWTKIHGQPKRVGAKPSPAQKHPHDAFGEIYVLGVTPKLQGHGLGTAAAVIGLRHLLNKGLDSAILYVDLNNTAAVTLYEKLGFTQLSEDILFKKGA
jgi:mycothiol synthase